MCGKWTLAGRRIRLEHSASIKASLSVCCPKQFELFYQYSLNNLLVFNILGKIESKLFKVGRQEQMKVFCFFHFSTKLADFVAPQSMPQSYSEWYAEAAAFQIADPVST